MDFYVSWSHSDPMYQLYDTQCSMLISISAVSNSWTLGRFPKLPYQIMLDSGSYSYVANQLPLPTPKAVFQRQLSILTTIQLPTILCAVDKPMLGKSLSLTERNQAIDKTIANAYELKALIKEYNMKNRLDKQEHNTLTPMAIVQGYDIHSLRYCARQLATLGYTQFGIGSMAHLYNTGEIIKRVDAVQNTVGASIHVFGVSAVETMKHLSQLEVKSVDSARPIKAAIYNEILYSDPYRRYGIASSKFRSSPYKFSEHQLIHHVPVACICPMCKGKKNDDILRLGVRTYLLMRAIHNYYHVKKTIVGWHEELEPIPAHA